MKEWKKVEIGRAEEDVTCKREEWHKKRKV
jgi:hypothetical protein